MAGSVGVGVRVGVVLIVDFVAFALSLSRLWRLNSENHRRRAERTAITGASSSHEACKAVLYPCRATTEAAHAAHVPQVTYSPTCLNPRRCKPTGDEHLLSYF